MKTSDDKIRTAVLLFSVILFCGMLARSNTPLILGNSPVPVIIELRGNIPKPGIYLLESEKATVSQALAIAGWSGTVPGTLADRKLTLGQSVTLLDRGGKQEIIVALMPAAARLAAGQKLDLNTASLNDLLLVPKMRADMASSIVKRRETGAWESVKDLQEIHGIGPKTSRKFEDYLEIH